MENEIKLAELYQKNPNAILDNRILICIYEWIDGGCKYYVWDAWGGIEHDITDLDRVKPYNN